MKKEPLVSVIIPTYNSERTIEKCLKSIKNQSYKNIELIVVDNNSTDKTKEIAKKYADKVYNKGPERSAQRNFGVSQSNGEYVLVHDSDIYFPKKCIEEAISIFLEKDPDALILPEKSIGEGYWAKVKSFERSFYLGNDYIEAARFFKKDVFDKMGGYDENLTGPEDWELTLRLRMNKYGIMRTKELLLHDEGKIDLFGSSKKKKYYAKDVFEKYAKMYPDHFKKQMSFWVRFPINKLLLNLIKHPILTFSMVLMKGLEYFNSVK